MVVIIALLLVRVIVSNKQEMKNSGNYVGACDGDKSRITVKLRMK